jgi:hypothetical protein
MSFQRRRGISDLTLHPASTIYLSTNDLLANKRHGHFLVQTSYAAIWVLILDYVSSWERNASISRPLNAFAAALTGSRMRAYETVYIDVVLLKMIQQAFRKPTLTIGAAYLERLSLFVRQVRIQLLLHLLRLHLFPPSVTIRSRPSRKVASRSGKIAM